MIKNLNQTSFSEYGSILADRNPTRGFPQANHWRSSHLTVSQKQVPVWYLQDHSVYLDFESGMTVLAASKDPEKMEYFYLDKPVSIAPGTFFAILPFQDICTVHMSMEESVTLRAVRQLDAEHGFHLSHSIQVKNIFTFFTQEKEKGFFFKGEKHKILELTYVTKGSLHSVADGKDVVLEPGDMFIYGSDQWHMQYADMDCAATFITITFDVQGDSLRELLGKKFRAPAKCANLISRMVYERNLDDPYSGDMIICMLGQLLLTVLREDSRAADPDDRQASVITSENEIINRALRYIGENVYQRLSVPVVARHVNVSTSYLTALFHKCLQISPGEYIRRMKLQESKTLIQEGRMNFTEIAEHLQYSTVHHFSRQFKEKFGITPTEYAKSVK